jgi:hypothetical protein
MIFSKQKGSTDLHIRNCEINSSCPSLPSTTSTLGTIMERQSKGRKRHYTEDDIESSNHTQHTHIGMERLQQQLLELQEQLQTQKKVIEELQQQQRQQHQHQQLEDPHQQLHPSKPHHQIPLNQYFQQLQQEHTENNVHHPRRSTLQEPRQAPSLCRMILPPAGERAKPPSYSQRLGAGTSPNNMSKDFLAGMRMGSQLTAKRSASAIAAAALAPNLAYADHRPALQSTVDAYGTLNNPHDSEMYDSFEDSPKGERAYHQDNQPTQEVTLRENMMRRMNSQMDLFWENQRQHLPLEQVKVQNYQYQQQPHHQQLQQPQRYGNDNSNYEAYKQSLFSQINMTSRMLQEQSARQQQQQSHTYHAGSRTAEQQQLQRMQHTPESPSNNKKQPPPRSEPRSDSLERPVKKIQKSDSGRHRSKSSMIPQGGNKSPASSNSHLRHPIVEP